MAAKYRVRQRFFADYRVQGALVARAVLYWLTCLLTMTLLLLAWHMLAKPLQPFSAHLTELWKSYGPPAIASLLILPVVIFDLLRLSNRFAGPVVRLRRSLHDLAHGKPVTAVRFRHGDFWQEFADDFNAVAKQAQRAKDLDTCQSDRL
jgi:hypothetical protein